MYLFHSYAFKRGFGQKAVKSAPKEITTLEGYVFTEVQMTNSNQLFPPLNTKCKLLPDMLGGRIVTRLIKAFQDLFKEYLNNNNKTLQYTTEIDGADIPNISRATNVSKQHDMI